MWKWYKRQYAWHEPRMLWRDRPICLIGRRPRVFNAKFLVATQDFTSMAVTRQRAAPNPDSPLLIRTNPTSPAHEAK